MASKPDRQQPHEHLSLHPIGLRQDSRPRACRLERAGPGVRARGAAPPPAGCRLYRVDGGGAERTGHRLLHAQRPRCHPRRPERKPESLRRPQFRLRRPFPHPAGRAGCRRVADRDRSYRSQGDREFPELRLQKPAPHAGQEGRAPESKGVLKFHWYNTPNLRFFSIADFKDLCTQEGIRIHRTIGLATERQIEISDQPNLNADLAIFVISR